MHSLNPKPYIWWPPKTDQDYLYRAYFDAEASHIHFLQYKVMKRTPKGAWILFHPDPDKFVNLAAAKQYASDTPAIALENLYYRWRRWKKILNGHTNRCTKGLAGLETIYAENEKWPNQ